MKGKENEMRKPWNRIDIGLIKKLAPRMTAREVATVLNRPYDSVDHKARRFGIKFRATSSIEIKEKESKYVDYIYALKEELSKVKDGMKTTYHKISKEGDTLIIQFTDWHVGKVVKDETSNEIYNEKVFKERIGILLNEILVLLDSYIRKGTPIRDVVIVSTGDILDGMGIYASQEVNSEMSPPFQVMLAAKIIQRFILSLIKRKLNVIFYGVKGNHGEIRGEGGKQKDPNANWDLMLYLILELWAVDAKFKNVKVNYSELNYLNFEVQGWRYHIRHIAPIQTETAAGKAKFLGWARKHKCDLVVYGH